MSVFFLILTMLTYAFSHFWARLSKPVEPRSFDWTKSFQGSKEEFTKQLEELVNNHPNFIILERTPTRFVLGEAPGILDYGSFYHISCEDHSGPLIIHIHKQPKLIKNTHPADKLPDPLNSLDIEDVS
jgi:hypothetical protein